MPLVNISLRKGRSTSDKKALSDAVHEALVETFQIPEGDRNHRFFEFTEDDFEIPEGKTEHYTIIELTVFSGRSIEAKRKLYQAIVTKLRTIGIPPTDVIIILQEPPSENWGIRGGFPANEVDIGFKVDV